MKVGDTVVLNDDGLYAIFGPRFVEFLQPMKKVQMKITATLKTGEVAVDNENIESEMFYTNYFDVVKQS